MKFYIPYIILFLAACGSDDSAMRDGDLIFQHNYESEFGRAISTATHCDTVPDLVHVGIFAVVDGDSIVIEATPEHGVVLTPLPDFLASSPTIDGRPGVIVKRYNDTRTASRAVQRALTLVGKPYDWEFTANNGKVYCSELVQYAFVDDTGEYIFKSIPMNFADADGRYPDFWVQLFDSLGQPIPQGQPGSNPNSIYKQIISLP